ncbi:hypothetical protein ACFUCV_00815 [Specibacter sp. NPDC057265]|uniref:hypothetical protein n=1 Tax=Specibacter sp. NPDC057265 TaxID=3346075 RepID=UPI0036317797
MTGSWDIRARVQYEGDAHVQEDACGFRGANAWIIDGATALLEPLGLPAASDPQWLAQRLNTELAAGAGAGGVKALLAGALAAIDRDATALVGPERVRFPSAAASVAQLNRDGVEVASLADCTVLVRTHDGVTHLVRASPAAEDAAARTARLRRDRELRNTPGKLWVARREPEAANHALVVQLDRPNLMVMASDGAWRAVELGLVDGPEEFLARTATTLDALELMLELRREQARIGEVADDATVLTLAPRPS